MTTVQEFLANDPLGKADSQLKQLEGMEQFGKYLPPNVKGVWPKVLSRFAHATPLCYWNPQILEAALSVLEANKERTVLALSEWKNRIGIGFDDLLRLAPTEVYEEGFANLTAKDLLHLANEFHPEYLRRCEHIFSNLIAPYWAILRKGGVNATFSVATAISCLKSRGYVLTDRA